MQNISLQYNCMFDKHVHTCFGTCWCGHCPNSSVHCTCSGTYPAYFSWNFCCKEGEYVSEIDGQFVLYTDIIL